MKVVNVIVGVVQKCVTVFVTRGSWAGRERIRDKSVNVIVARERERRNACSWLVIGEFSTKSMCARIYAEVSDTRPAAAGF